MSILVNPGYAIDQYGNIIKLIQQKQVNLASYVPNSNSRYIAIYVKFARKEYDTKINDVGEEIKYRHDEDCEIGVSQGDISSNPQKATIPPEGVLLADILLSNGQSVITTIDTTRRQNISSVQQHLLNYNNPHKVKMSQLLDTTLSDNLNANGKNINSASSITANIINANNSAYISTAYVNNAYISNMNATLALDLNANNKKITNLAAPSNANDAARKTDVDTVNTTLSNHVSNTNNPHNVKMSQLADTILSADLNANSKKITNLAAPSNANDAARKTDVDTVNTTLGNHVSNTNNPHNVKMSQLADTILSADLNANSKKITNLAAPTSANDAAR
ncbi:MAG: hypothetical protein QXL18_04455, partial [Candidatus Woesearchaeota archaeon]